MFSSLVNAVHSVASVASSAASSLTSSVSSLFGSVDVSSVSKTMHGKNKQTKNGGLESGAIFEHIHPGTFKKSKPIERGRFIDDDGDDGDEFLVVGNDGKIERRFGDTKSRTKGSVKKNEQSKIPMESGLRDSEQEKGKKNAAKKQKRKK